MPKWDLESQVPNSMIDDFTKMVCRKDQYYSYIYPESCKATPGKVSDRIDILNPFFENTEDVPIESDLSFIVTGFINPISGKWTTGFGI